MKVRIKTEIFLCKHVGKKANIQHKIERKKSRGFRISNAKRVRKVISTV